LLRTGAQKHSALSPKVQPVPATAKSLGKVQVQKITRRDVAIVTSIGVDIAAATSTTKHSKRNKSREKKTHGTKGIPVERRGMYVMYR
jgi:hypothetical protein